MGGKGGCDGLTHRGGRLVYLFPCRVVLVLFLLQRLGARPLARPVSGLRTCPWVSLVLFGLMRWTEMTDADQHGQEGRGDEG